jgi:hypothetical protein
VASSETFAIETPPIKMMEGVGFVNSTAILPPLILSVVISSLT